MNAKSNERVSYDSVLVPYFPCYCSSSNLAPTLFLAFQITSLQYVLITIIKNACKHRYITGEVMAGNTIGQLFRVTTFGESHGVALGCIIDGCPPG